MNRNTKIIYNGQSKPVLNAISILERDMNAAFKPTEKNGGIITLVSKDMPEEAFEIKNGNIYAGDDLGFIYALLTISEKALRIPPFWFWYDYQIPRIDSTEIEDYISEPSKVRYRGWFLNDEILLNHWSPDKDPMSTWRMAYEALLRCRGNLIIPTTCISRPHQKLAAEYGLWITHHHGEPLGADMFLKVYPGEDPVYFGNEDKYKKLWVDGIKAQKDYKVIWSLGFRGQGDKPFWEDGGNSAKYDTDEKRAKLIEELINYQYDLLHKMIEKPVCCVYIYGELAVFYKKGLLKLPEDVIKIWADNGYGKMVSRRMELDNPRIPAFPAKESGLHGIYYHVSYCDLRSCAHLTQIGNSNEFLESELQSAFEHGEDEFLIVNCSNIRAHVYPLAMIAKVWNGKKFNENEFGKVYFGNSEAVKAYQDYSKYAVSFGIHEDEHVGDHFYNYNVRNLISAIMRHKKTAEAMAWGTGNIPIEKQVEWFADICKKGVTNFSEFLEKHIKSYGRLFDSTIMLFGNLHYHGFKGGCLFGKGCEYFFNKEYIKAFYCVGLASDEFDLCNRLLRESEYGCWKGYYANDCFADFKFTAYLLRIFMTYIRNYGEGDGFGFDKWQRELFYTEEQKGVRFQINTENKDTSEEMFRKMKQFDNAWFQII